VKPAYSVILFTTLSGAGYGLLALLGLVGFNHGLVSNPAFGISAMLLALTLVSVGLLSSTLHLGHPERAWRAFSQWRSSWLSREGLAAVITYIPAVLFGLAWTGLWGAQGWIGPLGLATLAMCAVTVLCTGKMYSTLTTIRAWNTWLTTPVYFAFALATGATVLAATASLFDRFQIFQAILAVAGLTLTIVLKFFYWRHIDEAKRTHTMGNATGLGDVRQWEVPHTSENFVQKEMGFVVARKHAQRLRSLVIAFLVLAILAMLSTTWEPLFAIPAALLAMLGAFIERSLFFAEAQHVVTLFYGAERA
jgi:sulfite dehydrogenase (quinone) subunit SoeC